MRLVKADAGLVVAGLLAIVVGGLTNKYGHEEDDRDLGAVIVVAGVGSMAAGYGSGYVGYRKVKACRKARDVWTAGQAGAGSSSSLPSTPR